MLQRGKRNCVVKRRCRIWTSERQRRRFGRFIKNEAAVGTGKIKFEKTLVDGPQTTVLQSCRALDDKRQNNPCGYNKAPAPLRQPQTGPVEGRHERQGEQLGKHTRTTLIRAQNAYNAADDGCDE